jgi:hypothetical protein
MPTNRESQEARAEAVKAAINPMLAKLFQPTKPKTKKPKATAKPKTAKPKPAKDAERPFAALAALDTATEPEPETPAPRSDDPRAAQLRACEQRMQHSFREVAAALTEIRDGELYKAERYSTFETYCRVRLNLSKSHAYRLLDAHSVLANLEKSPMGDSTLADAVTSERHLRFIAKMKPEAQAKVIKAAVETAPKDASGRPSLTAAHVEKVARERFKWKADAEFRRSKKAAKPEPKQDPLALFDAPKTSADVGALVSAIEYVRSFDVAKLEPTAGLDSILGELEAWLAKARETLKTRFTYRI